MNITEKVIEILMGLCGEDTIKESDSLQLDLGFDSFAMVTLLVEIEETFDVQLDETDMNPLDLVIVQDVIDLVEKYCGDDNG